MAQSAVSRIPADTHNIEPPSVHPDNEPGRDANIPDNGPEAVQEATS